MSNIICLIYFLNVYIARHKSEVGGQSLVREGDKEVLMCVCVGLEEGGGRIHFIPKL